MPREKVPPPDMSQTVPVWFMTYSDVITLLMTFFILLLTFATSEPETFEQMKVALFGANGATGFASTPDNPIEMDSAVMRYRPDSSRLTSRGSETAPMYDEPALNSMAKGLEGLDQEPRHAIAHNYAVTTELNLLLDATGNVTSTGRQRLRMLARQLQQGPHDLTFQVGSDDHLDAVIKLADLMSDEFGVDPGRIAVGLDTAAEPSNSLKMVLSLGLPTR